MEERAREPIPPAFPTKARASPTLSSSRTNARQRGQAGSHSPRRRPASSATWLEAALVTTVGAGERSCTTWIRFRSGRATTVGSRSSNATAGRP